MYLFTQQTVTVSPLCHDQAQPEAWNQRHEWQTLSLCPEETEGPWGTATEWGLFYHKRVAFLVLPAGPLCVADSIQLCSGRRGAYPVCEFMSKHTFTTSTFSCTWNSMLWHTPLGVYIFESSASLLKCVSFFFLSTSLDSFFNTQVTSSMKPSLPSRYSSLGLVPSWSQGSLYVMFQAPLLFSLPQMCCYPASCPLHVPLHPSLCSLSCALCEYFWSVLIGWAKKPSLHERFCAQLLPEVDLWAVGRLHTLLSLFLLSCP